MLYVPLAARQLSGELEEEKRKGSDGEPARERSDSLGGGARGLASLSLSLPLPLRARTHLLFASGLAAAVGRGCAARTACALPALKPLVAHFMPLSPRLAGVRDLVSLLALLPLGFVFRRKTSEALFEGEKAFSLFRALIHTKTSKLLGKNSNMK